MNIIIQIDNEVKLNQNFETYTEVEKAVNLVLFNIQAYHKWPDVEDVKTEKV